MEDGGLAGLRAEGAPNVNVLAGLKRRGAGRERSRPARSTGGSDAVIETIGLERSFERKGRGAGDYLAVCDIGLSVGDGEFFCLLGPTGCGKSTVLRMIAGFLEPTGGTITVSGEPVSRPGADRGVVFQGDQSLFPWLTAQENVEYGLRVRGVPRAERRRVASEHMQLVGLAGKESNFPNELSGGMKQRIQIARVLANDPAILLMDEPFGSLDAQTRCIMQRELQRIWTATQKTVLFITHDIEEAVLLGDRIAVMTAGPGARIKVIRDVPLARPRNVLDEGFLTLREELRRDIEAEAIKAMEGVGV